MTTLSPVIIFKSQRRCPPPGWTDRLTKQLKICVICEIGGFFKNKNTFLEDKEGV
ncbi:MAG: hypothetical protein IT327_05570 [Anaerolineae bacterium]|nr:hypothetical protein [Anaerolineae bacterium]